MKNRTINRILQGVIVLLIIAICFLSVQIIRRPHYINISENEATVIEEATAPITSADIEVLWGILFLLPNNSPPLHSGARPLPRSISVMLQAIRQRY